MGKRPLKNFKLKHVPLPKFPRYDSKYNHKDARKIYITYLKGGYRSIDKVDAKCFYLNINGLRKQHMEWDYEDSCLWDPNSFDEKQYSLAQKGYFDLLKVEDLSDTDKNDFEEIARCQSIDRFDNYWDGDTDNFWDSL